MPSNFSCPVRRRRQGKTLKRGASQVCRDQDGESLIRISGRDSTGTYLRFHTSMRTSARACTSHARPRPRSIRANHAIQPHCSARAYPSKSACNHTPRTIYSDYFHTNEYTYSVPPFKNPSPRIFHTETEKQYRGVSPYVLFSTGWKHNPPRLPYRPRSWLRK
jgi:hypothetical protein